MQTFQGPFFELQVPDDWEQEIIENIPSFFDPEAGWVLQLAATRSQSGSFDVETELRGYLERNGLDYSEDRVMRYENTSGLECLACEFMRDNRFWLVQIIARGDRMLVALLNSDQLPDEELARAISATVASIRFTETN